MSHEHRASSEGAGGADETGGHHPFSAHEAHQAGRLKWVLVTVSLFFVVEFAGARLAESSVLEADALHLLMDVLALGMSLYAMRLAVRKPRGRFTFGLRRAEPLAALLNAALILAASAEIVHDGMSHLASGDRPRGGIMLVVAIMALVVNGISAWLLHGAIGHDHHGHDHHGHDHHGHDHHGHDHHGHDHHGHDHHGHDHQGHSHAPAPAEGKKKRTKGHHLNLRGAWLHLMGDTLGSLAALAAAIVIRLGGPPQIDPIASFFVVLILVVGALRLVRDATTVLLEAAPAHLPVKDVRKALLAFPGVLSVDELHVWTLGGGHDAIAVRISTGKPDAGMGRRVAAHLKSEFEVDWITVQADPK